MTGPRGRNDERRIKPPKLKSQISSSRARYLRTTRSDRRRAAPSDSAQWPTRRSTPHPQPAHATRTPDSRPRPSRPPSSTPSPIGIAAATHYRQSDIATPRSPSQQQHAGPKQGPESNESQHCSNRSPKTRVPLCTPLPLNSHVPTRPPTGGSAHPHKVHRHRAPCVPSKARRVLVKVGQLTGSKTTNR